MCFAPGMGEIGYTLATTEIERFQLRPVYCLSNFDKTPLIGVKKSKISPAH